MSPSTPEAPEDRPRCRGAAIGRSTESALGSFYVISHHAFHETGLVAIVTESHMIAWLLKMCRRTDESAVGAKCCLPS